MSTPNPTFPPLTTGLSWVLSTLGVGNVALPPGEAETGVTLGLRLDGDTTHSAGNYQWLIPLSAGIVTESAAALEAALAKLPIPPAPGANLWAAINQTDALSGSPSTSAWTSEISFSLPIPIVQPLPPTAFGSA